MKRVLAIGAHPDDVELGIGGVLLKLKKESIKVGVLNLSNGEPTPFGDEKTRMNEFENSMKILKISYFHTLNMTNRKIVDTIRNRKKIAKILREFRPDIIFTHYWVDNHPDHIATSRLVEAAAFYSKLSKTDIDGSEFAPYRIFHFLSPSSIVNQIPSLVIDISNEFKKKLKVIKSYESQFIRNEINHIILENLQIRNRYYGSLIGTMYGEAIFCKHVIGLKNLLCLFING